ncbi:MAG: HAMP domain-containing histidine kinase [Lachnospiraceae bacterium]|nr:HAMP domain-containing histidine kinase [Lachnospiraceae bacterium]
MKKGRFGFWGKVWAFIGEIVLSVIVGGCLVGGFCMIEEGFYNTSFYRIVERSFSPIFEEDARFILGNALAEDFSKNTNNCATSNIAYASVIHQVGVYEGEEEIEGYTYDEDGLRTDYGDYSVSVTTITDIEENEIWSYGDVASLESSLYTYEYCYWEEGDGYTCKIALRNDFTERDNYRTLYFIIRFCYDMRFGVYVIAALALIGWILLYILILRNAGYSKGSTEAKPIFESYIPFEINLGLSIILAVLGIYVLDTTVNEGLGGLILSIVLLILAELYFIFWSVFLAIRIKSRFLWKTMLLRYILIGLGKFFKWIGGLFKAASKAMPFIGKSIFILVAGMVLLLLSALCIGNFRIWTPTDAFGWFMFAVLMVGIAGLFLYLSISYAKIVKKTNDLANGNISEPLDKKYMLPAFKYQADDLEKISGGIVISNEKREASEKTQSALITNVSHDIKTPLTSIISYADLISKEDCENTKVKEYAEVLGRQSTRLKRLLEDLIEVSKAQSGALEVHLEPCKAAMLLSQAAGEFEERLEEKNLDLITKNADSDTMIMADPRRMWRVFDNLLGNICKYAQSGTRVYMSLEEDENKCRIIFKNTSAKQLDLSPEELMARFVRGDKSREGAEGNGLGLSIASSLTTLQKGTMDISIDGDLFKVILEFNKVAEG